MICRICAFKYFKHTVIATQWEPLFETGRLKWYGDMRATVRNETDLVCEEPT